MKKLILIFAFICPVSHAMDMSSNSNKPAVEILWKASKKCGPCCETCAASCYCCGYVLAGLGLGIGTKIKNLIVPPAQERRQ